MAEALPDEGNSVLQEIALQEPFSGGDSKQYSAKVECGFCFLSGADLIEPKSLPCSHAHCLQCIEESYDKTGSVKCPIPSCRYVFKCFRYLPIIRSRKPDIDVPEASIPLS